ncbi:hypothetical protein N7481_007514 [Penicillium waksmanii]|uniref:uncharacterized protein n=1 Tax=Penicillium waksmanii TaxID=69791 RepID=UPI00254679AA|nr:uncharacterized protein N7481_007514 [Penicillium waksmanii]KAJ5980216.1 hypothetical protein N7481_007514 [Penicillium waksmanii]
MKFLSVILVTALAAFSSAAVIEERACAPGSDTNRIILAGVLCGSNTQCCNGSCPGNAYSKVRKCT